MQIGLVAKNVDIVGLLALCYFLVDNLSSVRVLSQKIDYLKVYTLIQVFVSCTYHAGFLAEVISAIETHIML